ncbi:MAG: glycoside hydrolase family 3 protein, partial [Pedobacter sp.]
MFKSRKLAVILIAFMGVHNLQAQNIEGQIDALIKRMTLPEKVAMLHANSSFTSGGVQRLGIPEIVMSDGPHGVRPEHGRDWVRDEGLEDAGTYLPTGIGLAATWNRSLGHEYGKVLGSEANYRGKDIILGPGVNIIRSPLNGRNFEYLSEDPYLTAQMAIGYIKGVQSEGVSACVKHYAANNEEADRGSVDVRMSERALREIYLPAFEAAVKDANVNAVMGAYNKFRGQHTTHHKYLINDILKGEWGFKGLLMSDWGSVHDTKEALENGTDLEMGTDLMLMYSSVSQTEAGNEKTNASIYDQFFLADSALRLVKSGAISESVV